MHDEDLCRLSDWKIIYTLHGERDSLIVKAANMGLALLRLSESLGDFKGILYLNHIYECGGNPEFLPTYSEDSFQGARGIKKTDSVGRMDEFFENDEPPNWTLQDILPDEEEFDQVFTLEDFIPLYRIFAAQA